MDSIAGWRQTFTMTQFNEYSCKAADDCVGGEFDYRSSVENDILKYDFIIIRRV